MFTKVCFSFFVLWTLCSPIESITELGKDMKVIGGQKAKDHYPYQLSLQYFRPNNSKPYIHFCGASILEENYLLTAAHCIKPVNISRVSALAGVSDLRQESKGSRHQILSCIIHSNYSELISSDIALCKVQLPFVFGDNVAKIGINQDYIGDKVNCTLTGWGSIFVIRSLPIPFYEMFAYPNDLQEVFLKTMSHESCNRIYLNRIDDSQICTFSRPGQGACAGDSGGPLVKDGILVGVVSYGTRICTAGLPDVFTRVSTFYEWITSNMVVEMAAHTKDSDIHLIISSLPAALQDE